MGTGSAGSGYAYGSVDYPTALGLYGAQAAPQQGYLDQQDAYDRMKLAGIQGTYPVNQTGLQNTYDIGMGRVGLNQQQNQAAIRGSQADIDYWNKMAGIAGGRYGTAGTYFNAMQQLVGQAQGLRGQESDISLADALRAYQHNTFQFGSQQVGRGAWNTEGTKEGFGNLSSQYDLQQQNIRNQLAQANVGFGEQQAGLTKGYGDAYSDFQTELARSTHGTAGAQAQMDQLNLKAQEYGLDQRELANQLQQGLSNLNLDQTLKITDLMGALSSNDYQRQMVASQIISNAIQASGYMPGSYAGSGPSPTTVSGSGAGGGGTRFQ
jgi:hypothetical protein